MTIAPMSARRGSEPIAGAKVIISSELTKKSLQKVTFDRKREDFGSIFGKKEEISYFAERIAIQEDYGKKIIPFGNPNILRDS